LGVAHSLLGNFDQSEWFLGRAERLRSCLGGPPSLNDSMIPWTRALLARWRGQPSAALGYALVARDEYSRLAPHALSGQARINTVVADIALDLVEMPTEWRRETPDTMLTLARPYTASAVRLARAGADPSGEGLALLTQARFDSLASTDVRPLQTVESVLQLAMRLDDAALLSQAYMGLGKSFARAEADLESAIRCFDRALEVLTYSDVHVYEFLARRQAWQWREHRDSRADPA
jgi:hypothetical protein